MGDQPPHIVQPQFQQPQYQQTKNISDHFVEKGKLSLFLMLGALFLFIGVLFLDLCYSGLLNGDISAMLFLGTLVTDLGFIVILTLMILGGITREDLSDNTRGTMLRAAGFGLGLYIISWAIRGMFGGLF
ncbi:MAG: hypothetical protein KAJ33_06280 [Thermoplasmata archaeon]|nr:hypothetical protein [Thermoplasmata archaeon]MCK5397835.1 hypothetical protein [Thermoplasmata archaeon]